jgi:hypothetical protein
LSFADEDEASDFGDNVSRKEFLATSSSYSSSSTTSNRPSVAAPAPHRPSLAVPTSVPTSSSPSSRGSFSEPKDQKRPSLGLAVPISLSRGQSSEPSEKKSKGGLFGKKSKKDKDKGGKKKIDKSMISAPSDFK